MIRRFVDSLCLAQQYYGAVSDSSPPPCAYLDGGALSERLGQKKSWRGRTARLTAGDIVNRLSLALSDFYISKYVLRIFQQRPSIR